MSRPKPFSPDDQVEALRLTAKLIKYQIQLQELLQQDQSDPDIYIRTRIARLNIRDVKFLLYLLI